MVTGGVWGSTEGEALGAWILAAGGGIRWPLMLIVLWSASLLFLQLIVFQFPLSIVIQSTIDTPQTTKAITTTFKVTERAAVAIISLASLLYNYIHVLELNINLHATPTLLIAKEFR